MQRIKAKIPKILKSLEVFDCILFLLSFFCFLPIHFLLFFYFLLLLFFNFLLSALFFCAF